MIHYNFLKFKAGTDVDAIAEKSKAVYAELEKELDFLSDVRIRRCVTERESNADIMFAMRIDSPDKLTAYLQAPKHVALIESLQDATVAKITFDEED